MTEYESFNKTNVNLTCRACLTSGDNVHPMTLKEIYLYETLIVKVSGVDFNMYICIFCRFLLKKYETFISQCQKANDLLHQYYDQKCETHKLSQLISSHHITLTKPNVHYLGPENDFEFELKPEDYWNNCIIDQSETLTTDDDEIPLVMLSKSAIMDSPSLPSKDRQVKRKKLKLKHSRKKYNIDIIKNETDVKKEIEDSQESDKSVGKRREKEKATKEGFSSRMVQETDEYVVIKLNKDQVLQEMKEKLKSEKYIRSLYKCQKCVKGFNFEDVLQSHMEKHTAKHGSFLCDICTQYCPSIVSLRGHMKSHTTRYKCKVCGDVRLSRQHLLEHHAITHTLDAACYTCEHCSFTSNKRTVIQRHVKTHEPVVRHACHKCGKLFKNMESLRVHTARHDKSKRVQCDLCDRKFIYPSLLHKHMLSVHVRRDYYCVECDVKFKSPDNLRLHFKKAKRHRDPSSYKHQCPECEQRFVSTSTLSVHQTSAHGAPKQHSCASCRRLYSSREALRAHVRRVHSDRTVKGHSCHVCKRSFTQRSVLTKHMRTHTGERPYVCACGAAFAQPATLRAHRAAKHQDKQIASQRVSHAVTPVTPNEG